MTWPPTIVPAVRRFRWHLVDEAAHAFVPGKEGFEVSHCHVQTKMMGWVSMTGPSKVELRTSTTACAMRAVGAVQDFYGRVCKARGRIDLAQDLE